MTKAKILIIGNSHAGALIAASSVLKKAGLYVDWLCQPSALPQINDYGLIEGNNSAQLKVVKSREYILLKDYDYVLFSAFGSGNPRERKWNHPYFELQNQPLSTSLFSKIILSHLNSQINFIDKLVSVFSGNIFCQRQPRPLKSAIEGIYSDMNLIRWERYCECESNIIRNKADIWNVKLLNFPEKCELFTSDELVSTDPFHVNPHYGEIILKKFLSELF